MYRAIGWLMLSAAGEGRPVLALTQAGLISAAPASSYRSRQVRGLAQHFTIDRRRLALESFADSLP